MVIKERAPFDPDDQPIECEIEGCGKVVRRGDAVSYHVYIAMPGLPGVATMHCEYVQHFACSPEHAYLAADYCLKEHHKELTRLHAEHRKAQDTQPPAQP